MHHMNMDNVLLGEFQHVMAHIDELQDGTIRPDERSLDLIREYIKDLVARLRTDTQTSCLVCRIKEICLIRKTVSHILYELDMVVSPDTLNRGIVSDRFYCDVAANCKYFDWSACQCTT